MLKPAADSPPSPYASHPYRWGVLAAVWLVYSCFGLTTQTMGTLVKSITDDLGISYTKMGSILGAWPLVYIAMAIPLGALVDRIGVRWAIFLGTLIIAASGVMRSQAPDYPTLWLAVALFGLGGPLLSIGAPKLVSQWFQGRERGLAMGIYMTGPALGGITSLSLTNSVVLPMLGGDWRMVTLAYAGYALASGLVWLLMTSHPAFRQAEAESAAVSKRPPREIFIGLIRLPAIRIVLIMSLFVFFFTHGTNNWMVEILRSGGMTPAAAGYWASIPSLVGVIGSLTIPRLADANRRHAVLLFLFLAAGTATLLIQMGEGPLLAIGLICQGIAKSSMMTVMMLTLAETRGVDQRTVGLAGGLFFSAGEIGGVLGPLTVGFVSDLTGGFTIPLFMMSGICLLLVLFLERLRRIDRRAA